jgi:uncharacterized protein with HEPN domain
MLPEDRIRFWHIIDEAVEACTFVEGLAFDEFVKDGKTARAVIRSIEVIGEAASKVSMKLRKQHSDVPWGKIIGMRNRLIHVYFDIDYKVIWKTVKENLPPLIKQLESILEKDK